MGAKTLKYGVLHFSQDGDTFTPRANMRLMGVKLNGIQNGKYYQFVDGGDLLYRHLAETTASVCTMPFEPVELLLIGGRTYTFNTDEDAGTVFFSLYVRA